MSLPQHAASSPRPGSPTPPGPARSAALTLGVGQASIGFVLGGLGACLILFARDLAIPRGRLTWLSAGFGASLLLLGVAGAPLLRTGAGNVLRGSAAVLGLGAALLATGSAVVHAQAGALLLGLGGAGVVLACPALLAGPGADARLTQVNAASSIASVAAPLLMSLLDAVTGHGRAALLLPVPGLLWLAATTTRERAPDRETATARAAPGARAHASPRLAPANGAPSPTAVVLRWLGIVAAVAPEFAFVVWGAARLQDSGLTARIAAAAAAAFPIGMASGRLLAPRFLGRAPVVAWGVALAVVGALAAAAPVGPVLATAALAMAGLGIAVLYPVTLANLINTSGLGLRRGSALGVGASGVAVLAAPTLLNCLASWASLRTGFLAAVPCLLLVLALQPRGGAGSSTVRAIQP